MRNKSILEKPVGGTSADIADAIAKKHTQGTDQGLDTGGANATTAAQVKTAVTNSHVSGSDNQDLSGLVVKVAGASLVADTEIAKIHVAVTVSAPIVLTGQAIELKNNAGSPAQVTAIDTGVLTNSDTVIPTSKAVVTAIAVLAALNYPFWQILAGETITVPTRQQYGVFSRLDLRGTISLMAGAELAVFL